MICCFSTQKNMEKKPFATTKTSTSSYNEFDILEEEIQDIRMIFYGYIDILMLLKFIAILIILWESLGFYLAKQEFVMYGFIVLSISSFLLFCAIITAIQEENKNYILTIMILFYFKILLLILYLGIVLVTVYTDEFIPHFHKYFIQDSVNVIGILMVIIFFTTIQILLTTKAYRYFILRDELYTIPSVKVHQIRPELAHVLTKNKF
uniref:Transmembrane protein n=1 Tax=Strongyloides venezuelensis TaxID=75913 RepID=A0A0K0FKQ0_STRVS